MSPEEEKALRKKTLRAEWRARNKEKIKKYQKEYNEKNAARNSERHREWLLKNADRVKEAEKAYRIANAERIKEQHKAVSREWYLKNKGKVIAAAREWDRKNPEKRKMSREKCIENKRAADREYRRNNPMKMRAHAQNRKARQRSLGGRLSIGIVRKLLVLQKGKCACCKDVLKKKGHHIDHVIPLAKDGEHSDSNVQLLCPRCNMSKGAKHPVDFMQSRGFLL